MTPFLQETPWKRADTAAIETSVSLSGCQETKEYSFCFAASKDVVRSAVKPGVSVFGGRRGMATLDAAVSPRDHVSRHKSGNLSVLEGV
jgi:hypothetical protein